MASGVARAGMHSPTCGLAESLRGPFATGARSIVPPTVSRDNDVVLAVDALLGIAVASLAVAEAADLRVFRD
ncbi:MAG: hypothetical protein H6R02_2851 [Burkholderiaceae bacterium]|nr:hypothetical protein [Burkholderiaceae bacterium]